MEAIIFVGLQGSGKTSFYKDRFFATHVRISLDLLKTRHREDRILEVCLGTDQRFVIDNTNPTREDRLKNWQKRGVGLYWEEYDKSAKNPVTGEVVVARRRRIKRDFDLPMKDECGEFVRSILSERQTQGCS